MRSCRWNMRTCKIRPRNGVILLPCRDKNPHTLIPTKKSPFTRICSMIGWISGTIKRGSLFQGTLSRPRNIYKLCLSSNNKNLTSIIMARVSPTTTACRPTSTRIWRNSVRSTTTAHPRTSTTIVRVPKPIHRATWHRATFLITSLKHPSNTS